MYRRQRVTILSYQLTRKNVINLNRNKNVGITQLGNREGGALKPKTTPPRYREYVRDMLPDTDTDTDTERRRTDGTMRQDTHATEHIDCSTRTRRCVSYTRT